MGYIDPAAKLLRHPDRLAAWRAGKSFAPIGMELDLTNRCNLGCNFCHFSYTHTRGPLSRQNAGFDLGDEMGLGLLKRILPGMAAFGVKSVTFSGGGEPTLSPHFADAVRVAKDHGLQLGLYTNGTLITDELADLISQSFEWSVISLDAVDATTYRALKGNGQFEAACNGVRRIVQGAGHCIVGVSFLVGLKNYKQVEPMANLARELGAHYAEFRPIVIYDLHDPDRSDEPSTAWVGTALPFLRRIAAPDVEIRWDKFERYTGWQRGYRTCHAVQFTGVITPNGKVWTCVNRRGLPESEIGDLTRESFAEVWARVKAETVNPKLCRILCRGDALNLTLNQLAAPVAHENFV